MKITFDRTPEQVELVQAMASRNRDVAYEAQQSLAELMGPVLDEVIQQAPTLSNLFETLSFTQGKSSIPLDLFSDIKDKDYLKIWQQTNAGGLATNEVYPATQELFMRTSQVSSAVSFDKKHARDSRLDVVGKTFTRLAQEILLDQEHISASIIMGALANGTTNSIAHVKRASTSGRFLPEDFNGLDTRLKRLWTSWAGGTPLAPRHSVTDMIISPEVTKELRGMAYNAINTKAAPVGGTDGVTAPEAYRAAIFNSAGIPELWGVSFHEINEMGVGQQFNVMFDGYAASTQYSKEDGTSAAVFDGDADEIIVGLDRAAARLYRGVNTDAESGTELVLAVDDQFLVRQGKIGYFGFYDEGRVCLDDRALAGVIVKGLA